MNNVKRLLAFILALAAVFSLAACGNRGDGDNDDQETGETTSYTVTIQSAGGLALEKIAVSVYADDTLSDLQGYDETDANGEAVIQLPQKDGYAISLSGLPKGYAAEASYSFNGNKAQITLTSALIQDENLADTQMKLGDIMYDFTVTDPQGNRITLSDILAEKKMALINFWYTGCTWCVTEFPFMEEAYQMYQDKVGIVALDPLGETDAAIAAFPASQGLELSFPLASCPTTWANTFSISGYPTSVIVDRYGMIVLIEAGAITSLRPFTSLFETLTADDYTQKVYNDVGELVTNIKPTFEMDTSENITAVLGTSELEISFRPETGDGAEYSWPFIETEKNGEKCLKASNQGIDDSYAILYADVTLKKGQALGFDYLSSTESASDVLYVIVDGDDINAISGYQEEEKWGSCYCLVADADGTYEVALCYLKDSSDSAGDDTVYIKNMRIVDESEIDSNTYLPRQAATTEDGFTYSYADIVLNEKDGYYHVGSANGPLLLADLMNYTQFNEELTVWDMAFDGDIVLNGVDYKEPIEQYANYASNSQLNGICTVNQELRELLEVVDAVAGFDDEDNMEWLKLCKYFKAYGTGTEQLEDPIAGLAPFSAYKASFGKNVESNFFYYNRIIMPRGLMAEFVPSKSGVYRITSRTENGSDVDGWIFNGNRETLLTYEHDERMYEDSSQVSMVYYMEAGKPYYIDIAFWDPYEVGYIYYDIEYLGASYAHFRLCSPGYFTYDTDATGTAMYHTIAGGIDVVLGEDGIYYHDLGNGKKGSKIYADFTGVTLIDKPIASVGELKGLIEQGAFDFTKSEYDMTILKILDSNNGDHAKTIEYLKDYWGDDYDSYYDIYEVDDVLAGIYHGKGEDMTGKISKYLDKIITSGAQELRGCVVVTEELAELLQMLMDKFTFENVDNSWTKLCYYYDYMG